ncbi:hypothetical protein [Mycoplasma sp. 3686d]|uniref:hypothetical protein n=1 Tax=Mycoplasma sp. 3686d TaxID=2967300 RepID=UPI00211BB4E3|nr:hypothetical protein [Mycoplasma sp. 3686d]UUM24669.1 hypothetical protein NPA12_03155 [Mycoplasma sp. 3686d]
MIKIKNNKLKKVLIVSCALTVPVAVGLGATLFAIHSNEQVDNSTVYGNFLEGENLFKLYVPYINAPQNQKDQVANAYTQAKASWKSKDKGLIEKLNQLDKAQEIAFNFYIHNINQLETQDKEPSTFWTKIVSNQEARIRELDFKEQLTQHKKDQSLKFFDVFYTANNQQKQEYLKNLSEEISKLVASQNNDLNKYIKLLEKTSNKLDSVPFDGLKKDVNSSLVPLYSRIISANVRLNEIQIASQDTEKQVNKLEQMLLDSQSDINEINEYLKQIQPFVNNTAYNQKEKDNVKKFLDSTKINLDIALTKADINQIRNSVVTFYQQISDTQKTTSEIQQVIRELSSYVDKFNPLLNFNKNAINALIFQVASISNKKELISAKSDLFSQFYALKFADQLIDELNQKTNLALTNKIINKSKANLISSQIETIVNKDLPTKDLSTQLFAFYNVQIKELEELTYLNNELKLLQLQISQIKEFEFTNEDIKSQLNELNNQVVNTYSSKVTVPYLSTIKNKLNEELRNILKTNLKQLIHSLNKQIGLVKNLNNPVNANLIEQARKLNESSEAMVQDFNPIPSVELIQQIKLYNIKLQNLINANKQTQAESYSSFTNDYLREVFSNNDDSYVPTQKEQKRIDLYNNYKKRLDDLRTQINGGNGNPELEVEIGSLAQKLQNLINTANDFRDLSLLDKHAQKTLQEQENNPNASLFKPYIDAVISTRKQLGSLFTDPNVSVQQIINDRNKLDKALNDLEQVDVKILLEQKINQFKTAIDTNYQGDLSTSGSKALFKQYQQLLLNSQDVSKKDKIHSSLIRVVQLTDITSLLYQAKINKKRLLNIIADKNSAPYTGDKTNQAIANGRQEIANTDQLIERLNNPDNIPNLESIENVKNQLFKRGDEILLAYDQEKIEKINQHIQTTVKTKNNQASNAYKDSLDKVNNYATVQKSQLELEKATQAANKMELLQTLSDLSSQLLDSYNLYSINDSTKTLSDYIFVLLKNNELSVGDDNNKITSKTNILRKVNEIIKAKREFLEVVARLNAVLDQNREWKIYQVLKKDINVITQEIQSLIYNNDLTVEQIKQKTVEFEGKIKFFTNKKRDLLNQLDQAIQAIDTKVVDLDANTTKLTKTNTSYQFNTYYTLIKNEYENDKSLNRRNNVDSNDIKAYEIKLQIGYKKDLVLNKLKDLQTIATTINSSSSDLHNKIKVNQTTFDSSIKNTLTSTSLSLAEVEEINQKIGYFEQLFNLQKRIADYIQKPQTTSIELLKAAAETSLVVPSDNLAQVQAKFQELNKTYVKEVQIQELRENILNTLENKDLANGPYGIVKDLEISLGAKSDPDVITKLNNYVGIVKTSATTTVKRDTLVNLLNQVNRIKQEVPAIAQLAINVANGENAVDNLTNNNSHLINTYVQQLSSFLAQAKNSYFTQTVIGQDQNNINFYNNFSNQIEFTTKKLVASDALATKINQIQNIINGQDFNLRSLNRKVSLSKLKDINDYLNAFKVAATNNDYNQEAVEKINILNAKATAFKNIIDTNAQTLAFGNELATSNFAGSVNDLNDILKLVWDSIPRASAYTNSVLGQEAGNTYLVNDLFDLTSNNSKNVNEYNNLSEKIIQEIQLKTGQIRTRNEYRRDTNTKIQSLKQTMFSPLVHNDLKNSLLAFLDQLENDNNTQNTFTIDPDHSGQLNMVRSKIETIQEKLDLLKTLGQKVYDLDNFIDTIISVDPLVNSAKTIAQNLITKAKGYYNDADKMKLDGNESIENITTDIENAHFRLNLITKYELVKNQYDSDIILDQNEKEVIKEKLDAFTTAYNGTNPDLHVLFNTYFRNPADVATSEGARAKNSLIKYAFDNAVNLKREYTQALNLIALKDASLDSTSVETKFNQLTQLINGASGVTATLTNHDNDEDAKLLLFNTIINNIKQLISTKKDQLTEQLNADNELKNYFDSTSTNLNTNHARGTYVDNFIQRGIDDLNDAIANKDNLSYSQVNVYLNNAQSVAQLQIFDLYTKAVNVVENIKTTLLDYINDFAPSKNIVRKGADFDPNDYTPLLTLQDTINAALGSDFTNIADYSNKINALVSVITGNYQAIIDQFVDAVKAKFAQKFAPTGTTGGAGFYVNLTNTLDALKNNISGQQYNLYTYNQAEDLENQYDTFKNEFDSANRIYTSIGSKKDSGQLATFATLVNKLNHEFLVLERAIKDSITKSLAQNPLEAVFADLYQTIKYATVSNNTQKIKDKFVQFKQSIRDLSNSVDSSDTFDFTTLNSTSQLPTKLSSLINKLTEYKDWIKDQENKKLLLDQLDDDPNKANPLQPVEQNIDRDFDKKYKVIIANDQFTRKKFRTTFDSIVAKDPNATTTELVEIDDNDTFLEMFDQFAYTDKDVKDANDLKSIFSPLKLKVYIKKYDQNGWFDLIPQTESEVARQSLRAKVVYSYESNNVNIGGLRIEKDVVITFKTLDTIALPNDTSSIFINGNNVGTAAKVEAIDVDEAGWNIPQVASQNDANATSVKNEVITKVYNKMKAAIFDLNSTNSTMDNGIVQPNNNYLTSLTTTADPNLQNIRYNSSGSSSRLSAYLDKDNRNTPTKYRFDFENQLSIPITYNVSLTSTKDFETLNIYPIDNEKGFAFLQLNGGSVTGFPGYGRNNGTGKPETYDNIFRGHGQGFADIYNNYGFWWTTAINKLPTGINLNLYTFNIDYDPVARKVYFYNSWTENTLFVINKTPLRDNLNTHKNDTWLRQSEKDFLAGVATRFGSKPANYRPTPEELSKIYSIFSSLNDSIFNNFNKNNWLVTSARDALGGNPVYPIAGGQSTVYRKNKNDPKTATLRPLPSADFKNKGDQLIKGSARESLYSALINKFWFKIR